MKIKNVSNDHTVHTIHVLILNQHYWLIHFCSISCWCHRGDPETWEDFVLAFLHVTDTGC